MRGFTLLEVMLTVAIIAIIATLTPPVYEKVQLKVGFDSTVTSFVSSLKRAQKLSQAGKLDSTWGVKIENTKITIFKGNSFETRDITYDEESSILSNIIATGDTEIVFSKLYGYPTYETKTNISDNWSNEKSITINNKGLIKY